MHPKGKSREKWISREDRPENLEKAMCQIRQTQQQYDIRIQQLVWYGHVPGWINKYPGLKIGGVAEIRRHCIRTLPSFRRHLKNINWIQELVLHWHLFVFNVFDTIEKSIKSIVIRILFLDPKTCDEQIKTKLKAVCLSFTIYDCHGVLVQSNLTILEDEYSGHPTEEIVQ